MKKLLILAIAGVLYLGANAQTRQTSRDTTKPKNNHVTGQDSVRNNADKNQNRKREHKKNIYKDEQTDKK